MVRPFHLVRPVASSLVWFDFIIVHVSLVGPKFKNVMIEWKVQFLLLNEMKKLMPAMLSLHFITTSLKRGFSHLAMLDSLQSFCGLRHKHCRSRVMARGCVKYRMPGTEERTAISVSYRLQGTLEHKVLRQIFVSTVT